MSRITRALLLAGALALLVAGERARRTPAFVVARRLRRADLRRPRRRATPRGCSWSSAAGRSRWSATARRLGTPFLDISERRRHRRRARPALDRLRARLRDLRAVLRLPGRRAPGWASSRSASTGARPRTPTAADPDRADRLARATHNEASNHNGGQLAVRPRRLPVVRDRRRRRGQRQSTTTRATSRARSARCCGSTRGPATRASYTVPADNPFGTAVWAYGLRNPFRFSFDRGTGRPA